MIYGNNQAFYFCGWYTAHPRYLVLGDEEIFSHLTIMPADILLPHANRCTCEENRVYGYSASNISRDSLLVSS